MAILWQNCYTFNTSPIETGRKVAICHYARLTIKSDINNCSYYGGNNIMQNTKIKINTLSCYYQKSFWFQATEEFRIFGLALKDCN